MYTLMVIIWLGTLSVPATITVDGFTTELACTTAKLAMFNQYSEFVHFEAACVRVA